MSKSTGMSHQPDHLAIPDILTVYGDQHHLYVSETLMGVVIAVKTINIIYYIILVCRFSALLLFLFILLLCLFFFKISLQSVNNVSVQVIKSSFIIKNLKKTTVK